MHNIDLEYPKDKIDASTLPNLEIKVVSVGGWSKPEEIGLWETMVDRLSQHNNWKGFKVNYTVYFEITTHLELLALSLLIASGYIQYNRIKLVHSGGVSNFDSDGIPNEWPKELSMLENLTLARIAVNLSN